MPIHVLEILYFFSFIYHIVSIPQHTNPAINPKSVKPPCISNPLNSEKAFVYAIIIITNVYLVEKKPTSAQATYNTTFILSIFSEKKLININTKIVTIVILFMSFFLFSAWHSFTFYGLILLFIISLLKL